MRTDFKGLRKYHDGTGNDDYGVIQELQAKDQVARSREILDTFEVHALDVLDIFAGVCGILYHRKTGAIQRIEFTSLPYDHPAHGWGVKIRGGGFNTLKSLGILTSKEIDPGQEVIVAREDEDNVLRLVEQLESTNKLGIEQLRVLYPDFFE